jgi:putative iron-dependent peroxidase
VLSNLAENDIVQPTRTVPLARRHRPMSPAPILGSDILVAVANLVQPTDGPEAQPVLLELSQSAVFLVVSVNERPGATQRVRDVVSDVNGLVRAVGFRQSSAMLSCVVGFGSAYWDRIRPAGSPRPAGLHSFRAIKGARHDAPSTPGTC